MFGAPEMAGTVSPMRDGRMALGLESGLFVLDPRDASVVPLSAPRDLLVSHRFNEAAVDPAGRLVIGSMMKSQVGHAGDGVLYAFARGVWRRLGDGFWRVNGLAFSPDGRTIYVADSHPDVQTVWRASYDVGTGDMGEREVFATTRGLAGRPDGAAIDADGGYWLAGVDGGELYRFAPDGRLDRRVALPVAKPSRPCFGGRALDRLYVTSLATGAEAETGRLDGYLLELDVGVTGLALPAFAG